MEMKDLMTTDSVWKTSFAFLESVFRGGFSAWPSHPWPPQLSWSMCGVCQQRWVLFTGLFWNVLLILLAYMYPGCRLLAWGSGNRYVPGQNVNKSGTPYDAGVEGMRTHRWIISSLAKRSTVAVPAMRNTLTLMIYGEGNPTGDEYSCLPGLNNNDTVIKKQTFGAL